MLAPNIITKSAAATALFAVGTPQVPNIPTATSEVSAITPLPL